MKIKIRDLKDSDYSKSIYSAEPDQGLIESIGRNGVIVPIWVSADNVIISGHRRVAACRIMDYKEVECEIKEYSESLVIESNRYREKTWTEKLAEKEALEALLKPEAERREKAGKKVDPVQTFAQGQKGKTREKVAKSLGTSHETLRKVEIIKKEEPELFEKVDKGETTVNTAYNRIIQKKEAEKNRDNIPEELPSGQFKTIVIDPPWPIKKIIREVAPVETSVIIDYPTMSLDNIGDMGIGKMFSATGTHIFLWTTHKFLLEAFNILEGWGAKYIFSMVWHKPGGFQPFNLPQYNCEFILYGRYGTPKFTETKNFFTCFNAKRTGHSRKPDEFFDLIKRVCPAPRIEVFSRDPREGFEQYGNEANIQEK